jgi:hypothetical protein
VLAIFRKPRHPASINYHKLGSLSGRIIWERNLEVAQEPTEANITKDYWPIAPLPLYARLAIRHEE